jgi:hypothetical protein
MCLTLTISAYGPEDPFLNGNKSGWLGKIFKKKIINASQNISTNFFVSGFSLRRHF